MFERIEVLETKVVPLFLVAPRVVSIIYHYEFDDSVDVRFAGLFSKAGLRPPVRATRAGIGKVRV